MLSYNLLIKSDMWEKTKELICKITYAQLIAIATNIKETNWCTNVAILALKQYVKTVTAHVSHLYA